MNHDPAPVNRLVGQTFNFKKAWCRIYLESDRTRRRLCVFLDISRGLCCINSENTIEDYLHTVYIIADVRFSGLIPAKPSNFIRRIKRMLLNESPDFKAFTIISIVCLPNVKDQPAGASAPSQAQTNPDARSAASPCWAAPNSTGEKP